MKQSASSRKKVTFTVVTLCQAVNFWLARCMDVTQHNLIIRHEYGNCNVFLCTKAYTRIALLLFNTR